MELNDKKFAVLVDADNISHRKIKDILDEIANYGTPTIKRIYGDFTNPKFAAWKEVLLENSITPIQQYAYTTGKNATDSALIIDAMDILHKEGVDGFCIVSSDSDFTPLAIRLRESGLYIIGAGVTTTPESFKNACDDFILIDCPPSLGLLTLNCLCAADSFLVPLQCEYYALEGLSQLMTTVRMVKKALNRKLVMEGVLLTMFDSRTNLSLQVAEEVKRHFPGQVYATVIPRNVRLSEAPSHGMPVTDYDPYSRGAEAYRSLAEEMASAEG